MSITQITGVIAIFVVIGLLFWRAQAWPKVVKPKVTGPITIEEAPIERPVLQPWSPVRGAYTFAVEDLPEQYRGLQGIAGNTYVTQFGDDVDDARAKLLQLVIAKLLKNGSKLKADSTPAITAEPVKFKPLLKRKGQ